MIASLRLANRGWRTELLFFLAAYVVYNVARWVFVGDLSEAKDHARWIFELEQDAGVAIEGSVQRALDSAAASWLLSHLYLVAQLVVVPSTLIWLYRRSPELYRGLRNTVVATWLLAVPVFALFPVAPPRLADLGFADTVSQQAGVELTGRSTIFYNQLAAVPSLHVGFAAAVGVAAALALRRPWAKALALLWPAIVSLSVVATGNHYVFDIAAGLGVTGLGFAASRLFGAPLPHALREGRVGKLRWARGGEDDDVPVGIRRGEITGVPGGVDGTLHPAPSVAPGAVPRRYAARA